MTKYAEAETSAMAAALVAISAVCAARWPMAEKWTELATDWSDRSVASAARAASLEAEIEEIGGDYNS